MTYPEYLAAEDRSRERHDFIRGEVYAMSGGTPEHSLLSAAVSRELGLALKGRPAQAIENHRRNAEGHFVITDYRAGSTVEFASVDVSLPIAELYRDLEQFQRLSAGS